MFEILAGCGAVLAGLYLLWRDGLPVLNAYRAGVWKSQRVHVVRADEPERFAEVMAKRRSKAMVGFIVLGAGVAWLGWIALNIWLMSAR